jgi:hypothetical protein
VELGLEFGVAKAGRGGMMMKARMAARIRARMMKNSTGLQSLLFLPEPGAGCSMAGVMPALICLLSVGGGRCS